MKSEFTLNLEIKEQVDFEFLKKPKKKDQPKETEKLS